MSSRIFILIIAMACLAKASAETFHRSEIQVVGPIEYGQPVQPVRYTGHPRFRAFEFNAKPGDVLEVTVNAKRGRMEAYLTDSSFRKLAGGASQFTATIAANSEPASYYILVAEVDKRAVAFTLSLERPSNSAASDQPQAGSSTPAQDFLSCDNDSECVSVDRAGCCHNGWKDAVNKDRVGDYQQANACKQRGVMCPMYIVNDERLAVCDTTKKQCVMVKPEAMSCGGSMRNARSCPTGWTCKTANPDVAGICVKP